MFRNIIAVNSNYTKFTSNTSTKESSITIVYEAIANNDNFLHLIKNLFIAFHLSGEMWPALSFSVGKLTEIRTKKQTLTFATSVAVFWSMNSRGRRKWKL